MRFPTIYPNWLKEVKRVRQHGDGEAYEGVTPHGDRLKIIPKLGPKPSEAYFEIVVRGNTELPTSGPPTFPFVARYTSSCSFVAARWAATRGRGVEPTARS